MLVDILVQELIPQVAPHRAGVEEVVMGRIPPRPPPLEEMEGRRPTETQLMQPVMQMLTEEPGMVEVVRVGTTEDTDHTVIEDRSTLRGLI